MVKARYDISYARLAAYPSPRPTLMRYQSFYWIWEKDLRSHKEANKKYRGSVPGVSAINLLTLRKMLFPFHGRLEKKRVWVWDLGYANDIVLRMHCGAMAFAGSRLSKTM